MFERRTNVIYIFAICFNCIICVFSNCHHHPLDERDIRRGIAIEEKYADNRTKRSTFANMRIALFYDPSVFRLGQEQYTRIMNDLMPTTIEYFQRTLQVRQINGPILIARECPNGAVRPTADPDHNYCKGVCLKNSKCGEVFVPTDHLQKCHACIPSAHGTVTCGTGGDPDGSGVDADFVLYVSTLHTEKCGLSSATASDAVAYSSFCQTEREFDRPVAGHVNICPRFAMDLNQRREFLLSIIKHELLHSLAFSKNLFAFYRDEDGKPLTPRDHVNLPLTATDDGSGTYQWSNNTVRTVRRPNWWVSSGTMIRDVTMMVTPNVKREVRNHFKCETLEGAELEDQGIGMSLSHWEKRVFENEAMTGSYTHMAAFSRITLAMLEDTGWYKVDYEMADPLMFGKGLGCNFVKKSCGWWIKEHLRKNLPADPYCITINSTACTASTNEFGICTLEKLSNVPSKYQNYRNLPGVPSSDVKYYGGSLAELDYCAIYAVTKDSKEIARNDPSLTTKCR